MLDNRVIGVFAAKPFFFFTLLPFGWPIRPSAKFFLAATIAVLILLLGFMYWRDGEISFFSHKSVSTAMNGSLYSLAGRWMGTVTFDQARWHRGMAHKISKYPTILFMASYALLALRVRFTMPSAIVEFTA